MIRLWQISAKPDVRRSNCPASVPIPMLCLSLGCGTHKNMPEHQRNGAKIVGSSGSGGDRDTRIVHLVYQVAPSADASNSPAHRTAASHVPLAGSPAALHTLEWHTQSMMIHNIHNSKAKNNTNCTKTFFTKGGN